MSIRVKTMNLHLFGRLNFVFLKHELKVVRVVCLVPVFVCMQWRKIHPFLALLSVLSESSQE